MFWRLEHKNKSWVFPLPKSTIYVFSELGQISLIITFHGFNEKTKVDYDIYGLSPFNCFKQSQVSLSNFLINIVDMVPKIMLS